jgi:hypothetical protein
MPRKIHQTISADAALLLIRKLNRRIVTFSGFSSTGYEDPADVNRILSDILNELDPNTDLICSGATPVGIGAVYAFASSRGFETLGIVSAIALKERVAFADDVNFVYVIRDVSWGGYRDDHRTLSPTSRVMVDVADTIIFIGGGDIARDEYDYARTRGKTVRFFAADLNHVDAIEQARRNGQSVPLDFKGSIVPD